MQKWNEQCLNNYTFSLETFNDGGPFYGKMTVKDGNAVQIEGEDAYMYENDCNTISLLYAYVLDMYNRDAQTFESRDTLEIKTVFNTQYHYPVFIDYYYGKYSQTTYIGNIGVKFTTKDFFVWDDKISPAELTGVWIGDASIPIALDDENEIISTIGLNIKLVFENDLINVKMYTTTDFSNYLDDLLREIGSGQSKDDYWDIISATMEGEKGRYYVRTETDALTNEILGAEEPVYLDQSKTSLQISVPDLITSDADSGKVTYVILMKEIH
jgi:hypothetical protein